MPTRTARTNAGKSGIARAGKPILPRTLQSVETGLAALLTVAELHSAETPAGKAYVTAIRRRGLEAIEIAGAGALDQLRRRLDEAARPECKAKRAEILAAAWSDLEKAHA